VTWQMFDSLLLLSEGRTVFMGRPEKAVDYFADMGFKCPPLWNAADYILDVIAQVRNHHHRHHHHRHHQSCSSSCCHNHHIVVVITSSSSSSLSSSPYPSVDMNK
jgi:hypothetical protein